MNDKKSSVYAQKVELLLRLIPIVMEENVFAIHGGTAINLFLKDYPSVQWKLLNLKKLAKQNPQKLLEEAEELQNVLENSLGCKDVNSN